MEWKTLHLAKNDEFCRFIIVSCSIAIMCFLGARNTGLHWNPKPCRRGAAVTEDRRRPWTLMLWFRKLVIFVHSRHGCLAQSITCFLGYENWTGLHGLRRFCLQSFQMAHARCETLRGACSGDHRWNWLSHPRTQTKTHLQGALSRTVASTRK